MASTVIKDGLLVCHADMAPSPFKDYHQITVTTDQVILRWWNITLRKCANKTAPGEIRENYEDFLDDDHVHSEILRVFGRNMLDYVKRLAKGHIDYLPRLPENVLTKIVLFLDLEDIGYLAQVSKKFFEFCSKSELWEQVYVKLNKTGITDEVRDVAAKIGWRQMLFTNKLQLRLHLHRQKKRREIGSGDTLKSGLSSGSLDSLSQPDTEASEARKLRSSKDRSSKSAESRSSMSAESRSSMCAESRSSKSAESRSSKSAESKSSKSADRKSSKLRRDIDVNSEEFELAVLERKVSDLKAKFEDLDDRGLSSVLTPGALDLRLDSAAESNGYPEDDSLTNLNKPVSYDLDDYGVYYE